MGTRLSKCRYQPTMVMRSVTSMVLPMPMNVLMQPCASSGSSDGASAFHYALHTDRQSSHQLIAQLVRRIGRAPVLDVGAAQGFLGQLLQPDGVVIDAIEPHPFWAEHA